MDWREIIQTILIDARKLGLVVEIELVLGAKAGEVAALKIKTQAKVT